MAQVDVCGFSELAEGEVRRVDLGRTSAGLVRIGDRVHVFGDRCPHHGGPLSRGKAGFALAADGNDLRIDRDCPIVSCPWHGWEFSVETGAVVGDPSIRMKIYSAEVVDDRVLVALPGHRYMGSEAE